MPPTQFPRKVVQSNYMFSHVCVFVYVYVFLFVTKIMSVTYIEVHNNCILLWTLFDILPLIKPERKAIRGHDKVMSLSHRADYF